MAIRIVSLLTLFLGMPLWAQQRPDLPPPPPVLMVNGNSEVRVAPDEAIVRLGVLRQGNTARVAQEQTNAAATAILAALAKVPIPNTLIQTSSLRLDPVYANQRAENETPRIVGYRASNTVSVRVQNLSLVGPVIDAALQAGANQLDGVQFQLKDDVPARERALKEAVGDARRKAQVMADALGVRLGAVMEISEGGVSVRPYGADGAVFMARAEAAATPVSPGEVEVRAAVSVRYRIEPK